MDGMLFVCGIVACGLLWDFVLCLLISAVLLLFRSRFIKISP